MSSFSIYRDKKPYQLFSEDLKIVIVELSKLTKACDDLLDLKEKWCYFLRESDRITKERGVQVFIKGGRDKDGDGAFKEVIKR